MIPFRYRNQPLKTLWLLYSVSALLLIRIPFYLAISAFPAGRPRRQWPFTRAVIVRLAKAGTKILFGMEGSETFDAEKDAKSADKLGFVWVNPVSEELVQGDVAEYAKINNVRPARVSGYWYGKRDANGKHGQSASPGEKIYYYFHGGGMTRGTGSPVYTTVAFPNGLLEYTSPTIQRLFAIEYRLCSSAPFAEENGFPAPLIDALSGYKYLLELGFLPENIVLAGDSAGGYMGVVLMRYLLTSSVFPIPRALVLMSPTLDWGFTHDDKPNSAMTRNADSDFIAEVFRTGYSGRSIVGKLPESDVRTNPWISPCSLEIPNEGKGHFIGFPPTCIMTGGAEVTLDPMVTMRDRLERDVGPGKGNAYFEYANAVHDFTAWKWHEPERTQGLKEIAQWVEGVFV